MIYAFGFAGFIGGFLCGQMVLYFLLRHKTRNELLNDKTLKLRYGLLNWLFAGLGAYSFVVMYNQYFN